MKLLTAGGGSYLTGSAIADAVMRYGLVLARRRDIDLVDIPYRTAEGLVRRAAFTIGWHYETHAITSESADEELIEAGTTLAIEGKADAQGEVRGHPFTVEEAADFEWPDGYGEYVV